MVTVVIDPERLKRQGDGLTATYNGSLSTSNEYRMNNNGKMFLHFLKTAGVVCVVTVQTPGTVDGNAIAELAVTVPADTGDIFIGPFDPAVYNAFGQHYIAVTLSNIAGVTFAAIYMDG